MRLHDVANAFNDLSMYDGYTNDLLGTGQLDPWDGNKRDGVMGERRTLSLQPSEAIPTRRVVACANTQFILGHASSDDWRGTIIRTGYVVQEATELAQVRTLEQVCLSQAGFNAWCGRVWDKDVQDVGTGSGLTSQNSYHFALDEPIVENMLVSFSGRLNVVRSVDGGSAGTLIALCDRLREPSVETATLSSGTYDPITDTMAGSPVTIRVVRVRWQSLFSYSSAAAPKFQPGDIQVVVAKSVATPAPGATLTLSDGQWRVESVLGEGPVWLCRATCYA